MILWKVDKYYFNNNDTPTYEVTPYRFKGYLKWYGLKGLKWCYLFKKQAERKARKLNKIIK